MNTLSGITKYEKHRFPVEIISHAVWLYFRFCLSFWDVEEIVGMQMTKTGLLAARAGWHHIANFYLLVGDDNVVNQELDQLPFLREGGLQ